MIWGLTSQSLKSWYHTFSYYYYEKCTSCPGVVTAFFLFFSSIKSLSQSLRGTQKRHPKDTAELCTAMDGRSVRMMMMYSFKMKERKGGTTVTTQPVAVERKKKFNLKKDVSARASALLCAFKTIYLKKERDRDREKTDIIRKGGKDLKHFTLPFCLFSFNIPTVRRMSLDRTSKDRKKKRGAERRASKRALKLLD